MILPLVIAVVLLTCAQASRASTQDTLPYRNYYVHAPDPLDMFTINGSVGLSLTLLPQPLVESEVPAPALDIRYRIGLPLHLSLVGRITGNYAANLATLGPMWSAELTRVTLGGGIQGGFMYGHISFLQGFNTTVMGAFAYPFATAGIRFDDFTVSGKLEAEVVLFQQQRIDDIKVSSTARTLNGGSLTLVVEQPFWRTTAISLGATLHYSRNPYQAWLAFNTFDDVLFYPELFAGFIF